MKIRFILIFAAALGVSCSGQRVPQTATGTQSAPVAASAPASWGALTERFIEDYFKAQPFFAVHAGRHEFDGRMPDWSRAAIEAEIARLHRMRAEVSRFSEDSLEPQRRFEREYLLGVIDTDLFWLDVARFPFRNPVWYVERLDPQVYLSREYAPLEKRLEGYIGYARAIPKITANVRENLRAPLPKTYVERAISGFGGFAKFYRNDVPQVFAAVENERLRREFLEANEAAARAMDDLSEWFESLRADATDDFALGESVFAAMLRQTERVDVPLADLVAAGRADLERNLAAVREACARFHPEGSVRECIGRMQAHKPEEGAVDHAQSQLVDLKAFLLEKNVVTIPGTEEALVREAPPYNRANSAYINIPGPYEKGLPSIYYVAPPDPAWTAAEQAAYIPAKADLLFTSVHEVWPGHFLQFLHSNRNPSTIASLWVGYAYAEGWAHYTEEMMWEMGLEHSEPEAHIGQLTNALLRNVRFLSAIGLHSQGMTVEQSEQLFRDSAFTDAGTARQQAARGTYDPAYLNYTLGKLMIRKLRSDWLARQAGTNGPRDQRTLWREFHDRFLSYGGPPIPLVRKAMVGEEGSLL